MIRAASLVLLVLALAPGFARADEETLRIQAVGDLNLAGNAEPTVRAKGFAWAFDGTRALLAEGDLNIANLETPVTAKRAPAAKTFTYRMPPVSLDAIRDAKFGLVSLANNHTLDQGPEGLFDTLKFLDERAIAHAGAGTTIAGARAPAIVTVKGVRVGFLSYSLTFPDSFWATARRPGTAFGHEAWVREDIAKLRARADLVIVAFHWGAEKHDTPKDYQRSLARAAIAAGADAVIGHHPHVLQGLEVIDGRPVIYSLGNYAFGSNSNVARDSALARLNVVGGRVTSVEFVPLHVHNRVVEFNPRVAEGEVLERILATLERLSTALGTTSERAGGRLVVRLESPPAAVLTPPTAP